MKKTSIITVIFILTTHLLQAQVKMDSIDSYKNWQGATILTYDGKKIKTMRKLSAIISNDQYAYHIFKKATHKIAIGLPFAAAGFACLVTSDVLGFTKGPSYNENPLLISSLVFVGIAFPFAISARVNVRRAVRLYNSDIQKTSFIERQPQLYFGTSGTAVGIGLRF